MNLLLSAVALVAADPAGKPAPTVAPPVLATPAADPQRLALALTTVDALFPAGTSSRLIADMMGASNVGRMLDLRPADLGMPGKAATGTIGDELKKKDPHFDQRMAIIGRVIGEEMKRLAPQIEAPLRDGLADSVARRFTAAELADINRFFATDSGKAFGRELWLLWFDPAIVKGMVSTMPVVIKKMPAVMKKVDAATAHLPKPKPKIDKKPD